MQAQQQQPPQLQQQLGAAQTQLLMQQPAMQSMLGAIEISALRSQCQGEGRFGVRLDRRVQPLEQPFEVTYYMN